MLLTLSAAHLCPASAWLLLTEFSDIHQVCVKLEQLLP